uniref:CG8661 protein n=1 Tax=Drosophila melanogaster TaxID=7227 RepID=E1UIH0_DROME|nr:CG8661 protein [Drosophila melanogaster]
MKYTILILALGLFCVNALVAPVPSALDSSPELDDVTDGSLEVEDFGVLSTTYKSLKIALRSIKGLNCIIKWVAGIKDSATQFNTDVVVCGVTASKEVTKLINANNKILSTCNDLINLRSNTCPQTDDEETKVSGSCFVKTLRKVWSLKKQVDNAIKLAKKIPQTGPNAVACVSDAVNTLTTYYTAFPQNIISCSKLTS